MLCARQLCLWAKGLQVETNHTSQYAFETYFTLSVKNVMLISDVKYCPLLEPKDDKMAWRCKGGVNPYFEMTPEGTYCYTQ